MADRNQLSIHYDPDNRRFLIRCPVWANDMVHVVPSCKWSKKDRAWAAPMVQQNVIKLRELSKMGGVVTDEDAIEQMGRYEDEAKAKKATGSGFPPWYSFKRPPLKHQMTGLNKLYHKAAGALYMEMQTGKSKVAIDLCAAHRMEGHVDSVLVVTKLSLRRNWEHHFAVDCPIPYDIYLPSTDKGKHFERWNGTPHDFKVMVVGWESLSAGRMPDMCKAFLSAHLHPAIVGDETTYITNFKAARTKHMISFAKQASYRYALAGEPWLEGPMNLFSQFEFLDPDIVGIGDFYAFRNRYAIMGGFMREMPNGRKIATEIVGYRQLDELARLITPYTHEVRKKDEYDLPPKRYEVRTVELTKVQRDLLIQIKREEAYEHKGTGSVVMQNVLEAALRRHQITGGYAVKPHEITRAKRDGTQYVKTVFEPVELVKPDKNPKMIEVVEFVEEWKGKKQGLLWAVYMPEIMALTMLMRRMGLKVGELHGGVPENARQGMVDEFQRGGLDIVVGNASTGGMGYTMMAAEVNMFYNNTFKAIDRVQAEDRSWGQGQTKSGIWVDFAAEKTIDFVILKALEDKLDLSAFLRQRIKDVDKLLDGEL